MVSFFNNKKKVIVRLAGGLGNQLFIYCAARRLAIINNAELIIDDKSGFLNDKTYNRKFQLQHFNIKSRKASYFERLSPFSKLRRFVLRKMNNYLQFNKRILLTHDFIDFDIRLLFYKVKSKVYVEGLWQSEKYFIDVKSQILDDLKFSIPTNSSTLNYASLITNANSIAIHFRFFDSNITSNDNIPFSYYHNAIDYIKMHLSSYTFFVFSDDIENAKKILSDNYDNFIFINRDKINDYSYDDLWLMSLCKHFIIANSTFSWWGAWLSTSTKKIVVAPKKISYSSKNAWGFKGLIPENWIQLK